MATIARRLQPSWFGRIPSGLRLLLVIVAVIAVATVVIKFTVASGSNATAQTQQIATAPVASGPQVPILPVSSGQAVPQAPTPTTLTQAELTDLQLRVDKGTAAVVSNDPLFLAPRVGAPNYLDLSRRADRNAVVVGQNALTGAMPGGARRIHTTPQINDAIYQWGRKIAFGYAQITANVSTTREFHPNTQESISYIVKEYHMAPPDGHLVLANTHKVTLTFTFDGKEVKITGFNPQN